MKVRAIRQLKGDDPVRSTPSRRDAHPHRRHGRAGAARCRRTPRSTRAGNDSLDIALGSVETATRYRVQLASDDSFRKPRIITSDGRTATFTRLDAATPFVVRVRALGEDGSKKRVDGHDPHRDDQAGRPAAAVGRHLQRPLPQLRRSAVGQPARRRRRRRSRRTASTSSACRRPSSRSRAASAPSQFADLMRQLDAGEGGWKITDQRINGTLGVRIIYNTRAVRLVKAGATRYANQQTGNEFRQRFYTWADLHAALVRQGLPVRQHPPRAAVGPRPPRAGAPAGRGHGPAARQRCPPSSSATSTPRSTTSTARTRRSTSAGYVDPLGVMPSSHQPSGGRHGREAHQHPSRQLQQLRLAADQRASATDSNGTYIDYIFSTPMRVLEYENVVDLDASGRFRGGPPSDHNMLRAVVGLP